jgi:uncharacterized protein
LGPVARTHEIDSPHAIADRFPRFTPHRLLRSGHLQTVAATLWQGRPYPHRAKLHPLELDYGDTTFLHDDRPAGWDRGGPAALLVHGLGGCARSSYMTRAAGRLNEAGVRTFRLDFRACGRGEGRSRLPYHAGCSEDALLALERVAAICPASPLSVVGFSIGGNVALKMLGEMHDELPAALERAVVISPPIDLNECVGRLSGIPARYYDRHLVKLLYRQLRRSNLLVERAPHVAHATRPLTQKAFDELYTARVWGFDNVEDFYAATSSLPHIGSIRTPTLVIASRDDPLVPVEMFERLEVPAALALHLTDHGGHLGFIGRAGTDPDRRWMDWRLVDWLTAGQAAARRSSAA